MREVEVLIVGGGVAGTTAAETYRAGGGAGEVVIVSDEAHPLYSRVLLPHAVKGKISPDKTFLKKLEFYAEKSIETLFGRSVTHVDYGRRIVALDGGEEISYRKLVIAIGGKPRAWDVPGADADVLRLQTYEDAAAVAAAVRADARLAIVGSGFIGLEFAAIAVNAGAKATVLNRGPRFWTSMLGAEIAAAVQSALEAAGVEVRNHAKVAERTAAGVRLSDGSEIACDLVAIGIGVEIPVEPFGDLRGVHGLSADASLKAKHKDVWIAGDCAEFEDGKLGGLRHVVGNWTNAMAQGRHVGKALLGEDAPYLQLTQYTTNVIPGANLIFLGECRDISGSSADVRVVEEGKKIVEYRMLGGRVIGAILLNAPELRAEASAKILA
ncbi:MAG TPA: NAD(P)/FAD-dependent oxidoreductase [Candidatus Baltobacteraceae bacterium]|nr:NAD(P)/FAD-dependent oxidoreductase [Candidatus Baltobacteraceae bacterium]